MKVSNNQGNQIFTRKNLVRTLLGLAFLALTIVITLQFDFADIKLFLRENKNHAIIISLLIYVLFGLTFIPSIPLTLFIAVLLGPAQAALIAAVGNTGAAFCEYHIGKSIGNVIAFKHLKERLPFGLSKLPIHSPLFLLAVRSIPAGTRSFSLVCGAYQVPMPVYLWTTFAMYLTTSVFLSFGGAKLISLL